MKTTTKLLLFAFMAIMSLSLTSCDEDQLIAADLQGTWEGYISDDWYSNRWQVKPNDRYYTVWHFDGSLGSRGGRGWEDCYDRTKRYYLRGGKHVGFSYYVRNRRIEIVYDDKNFETFYIDNYSLSEYRSGYDQYFNGVIYDERGREQVSFRFVKNNDDYDGNYYYSKKNNVSESDKDSTNVE